MEKPDKAGGQPPVEFTLDGVEVSSADRKMPSAEVLRRFGDLDPATYDNDVVPRGAHG